MTKRERERGGEGERKKKKKRDDPFFLFVVVFFAPFSYTCPPSLADRVEVARLVPGGPLDVAPERSLHGLLADFSLPAQDVVQGRPHVRARQRLEELCVRRVLFYFSKRERESERGCLFLVRGFCFWMLFLLSLSLIHISKEKHDQRRRERKRERERDEEEWRARITVSRRG